MEANNKIPTTKTGWSTNLTLRAVIVFILILVLMIPMIFVGELVRERLSRQGEVKREVSSKWAENQRVTGPILIIPYKGAPVKDKNNNITGYEIDHLYILPNELNISGTMTPHTRHRSIFDVTVYQANLAISGNFEPLDTKNLQIPIENMYFEDAQLYMGISDFRGLEEQVIIKWEKSSLEFTAGSLYSNRFMDKGLFTPVSINEDNLKERTNFSMNLKIKGSEDLFFTPLGKTNNTRIASTWTNPSFKGNFIPNNPADINPDGFDAEWNILYLNRSYPQIWKNRTYELYDSQYGICLLQSVDSYAKTARAQKYAILFIALTFAIYFFVEILQRRRVHPVQYALVGVALCIFYVLLLSLSEYLSFNLSYAIASLSIITMITLYTKSAFANNKVALVFGAILSLLYLFIFILIQLEDKALLFGSIGLFAILAAAMYYSRKIDWYGQNHPIE